MLKVYKFISHDIYKAHNLIEYLVNEVWCKADKTPAEDKLNKILKSLYDNGRLKDFKTQVNEIYEVCKTLTNEEKAGFKNAFENNNKIKELCEGTVKPISLSTLNNDLVKKIEPFFKSLYTGFLGWKIVTDNFGNKKEYYDKLNLENGFIVCPCCGYGDLKTIYSKGRSAFDHYLPQKHYPFSSTNFNNLVPICSTCNSNEKGEDDVLKPGKRIFYPFENSHPKIEVIVDVDTKALQKLIEPTESLKNKINKSEIKVNFNLKDDRVESWDSIFDIRTRYFGKICDNRIGWFKKVKKRYDKDVKRINNYKVVDAFDDIIDDDSDEQLGFLKAPYLESLKSNQYLVKAINEVSDHSIIK